MTTKPAGDDALSPTALHVARTLEDRIWQGAYREGQCLPSERLLANDLGVSRQAVRAALDTMEQRELVLRSARCRPVVSRPGRSVMSAPPRGTELPRARVRAARRSIAVSFWPSLEDPASAAMICGVRAALDAERYRLIVETPQGASWDDVLEAEARFLERVAWERDCEGVLLYYLGGARNADSLRRLQATKIPLVYIDRLPPPGVDGDYVGVDNVQAAEEAVQYLIALGHRRIAHLSNSDDASTVAERERGYCRALRQAGIAVRPEWIVRPQEPSQEKPGACRTGAEQLVALLKHAEPPTAVFVVNDLEAFFLLDLLKREKVRVPEDLAVIGFDGAERWRPGAPYLATMYQPFERIGECAVDLLLERMSAQKAAYAFRHVLLSGSLVPAATTARSAPADRGQRQPVGAIQERSVVSSD